MPDGKTTGKTEGSSSVTEQPVSLSEQFHTPAVVKPSKQGEVIEFRIGHMGNYVENMYSNYANSVDVNLSPEERASAEAKIRKFENDWAWIDASSLHSDGRYKPQIFETLEEYGDGTRDVLASYTPGEGIIINRLSDSGRDELRNELSAQAREEFEEGLGTQENKAKDELRAELSAQARDRLGNGLGMQGSKLRDELHAELSAQADDTPLTKEDRFALGDATAVNFTYFHELNHRHDYEKCQMQLLKKTPMNAAKSDRLTETKSYAVEYLAAAQQYVYMKEQGITSIVVDGKEQPLDMLIGQYPGLKEVVDKYGFDAKNPESVRRVVAASAESWKEDRRELYVDQMQNHFNIGLTYFSGQPLSKQLELLKNQDAQYQEVSSRMLSEVYIGNNTKVDLSGCRDLLDTATNEDINQLNNKDYVVSYEELKSINDYLEKKGITDDNDKMRYLSEHLKNLAYRLGEDKDPELTKLLLAKNNSIVCADGLAYSLGANGEVVFDASKPTRAGKPAQAVKTDNETEKTKQNFSMLMMQHTR